MIVHAYRRTKPITLDFDPPLQFTPNGAGDIVCDVPDGPVLRRLLDDIPEAYRAYVTVGADAPPAPPEDNDPDEDIPPVESDPNGESPYILTHTADDGATTRVDLRMLDNAALDKLAAELEMPTFHHKTKEQGKRDRIVAFLKG